MRRGSNALSVELRYPPSIPDRSQSGEKLEPKQILVIQVARPFAHCRNGNFLRLIGSQISELPRGGDIGSRPILFLRSNIPANLSQSDNAGCGFFLEAEAVVARSRDLLVDKKIGSVIRMQRVKLGMSQTELGDALGVTFQQNQKYELGKNAVASTRIADLCRALEMTPNDLFGVSSKIDGDVPKLTAWTMKTALKLQDASPALRQAIDAMLNAVPKR
jgi:transcriptional regulator with XRE-family HTH domain